MVRSLFPLLIFLAAGLSASMAQNRQFTLIPSPAPNPQVTAELEGIYRGSLSYADIDGDTDLDILVTGQNVLNVRVANLYINNGLGTYLPKPAPFDGVFYSDAKFADIDGDGDQDVFLTGLTNSNDRIAKMYLNDGLGNYTQMLENPFAAVFYSEIGFNDIDSDGDQDLIYSGRDISNQILTRIYRNDGSGSFTEDTAHALVGVYLGAISFADVDNDNDDDLVLSGLTGSIEKASILYLNDGNGEFTEKSNASLEGVFYSASAFADIDGDGDLDLFQSGANADNERISNLYRNDGEGKFVKDSVSGIEGVYRGTIGFSDVDGDNDLDAFISGFTNADERIAYLFSNDGTGSFSVYNDTTFEGVYYSSQVFTDLNRDGLEDIILTGLNDANNPASSYYIALGEGKFTKVQESYFAGVKNGGAKFNDLNGDNILDLFLYGKNANDEVVSNIYLIDSVGISSGVADATLEGFSDGDVVFGDLDNDGDMDFVTNGLNSVGIPSTLIFENDSTGNFSQKASSSFEGLYNGAVLLFDFNNDGYLDIVSTGQNLLEQKRTNVFLSDGLGGYANSSTHALPDLSNSSLALADIDNDESPELILTGLNSSGALIAEIYTFNALGIFSKNTSVSLNGIYDGDLAVADLNGDGFVDILLSGKNISGEPSTLLFQNDGEGDFSEKTGHGINNLKNSKISISDIDKDETIDVIISGENSAGTPITRIFLNEGSLIFSEDLISPIAALSQGDVSFVNLDADNAIDIFTTGVNINGKITAKLYKNNNCFEFASIQPVVCETFTSPSGLHTFDKSGVYFDTLSGNGGCDTFLTINLTINRTSYGTMEIAACENFVWDLTGETYTKSGTLIDTIVNVFQCDSIVTLNLTILKPKYSSHEVSTCESHVWDANQKTYYTSGVYVDTFQTISGCDSIVTLNLDIKKNTHSSVTQATCESFLWDKTGETYTESGKYDFITINSVGCDSIITLDLTINSETEGSLFYEVCESFYWNLTDSTYEKSGYFITVIENRAGCDSIVSLTLKIKESTKSIFYENACESYLWPVSNERYYYTGMYSTTLINAQGCDSLVLLNLRILEASTDTFASTSCESFFWKQNGQEYDSSGMYTDTILNSLGCDSVVKLNLTILNNSSSIIQAQSCESYTWEHSGQTYTTTGMYPTAIPNHLGCDSIVTLDLVIFDTEESITETANCESYFWVQTGQTYSESGTYTDTLRNLNGCDSFVVLNLTINLPNEGQEEIIACGSYTWPANGETYRSSGFHKATLPNINGCDSIATIYLTIKENTTGYQKRISCDTYTWPVNNQTYTESGVYEDVIANAAGCDSVITLNLFINKFMVVTQDVIGCDSFVWKSNGMTYTESGSYIDTFTNRFGCDSFSVINLTIQEIDNTVSYVNGALMANEEGASYRWLNCNYGNAVINGANERSFTPKTPGPYAVQVIKNGCAVTSECYVYSLTNVETVDFSSQINAFPNPTNEKLNLDLGENFETVQVTVFNIVGQQVLSFEANKTQFIELNLEGPTGMYYVKLNSAEKQAVIEVIKK